MLDTAAQRTTMVAAQLRPSDVTDSRILDAMMSVPRERFVPDAYGPLAYMEDCVPLGQGRVLPDPRTFAKLLQLAAVAPESRVLDVGCATGYSTAVLSFLAREIVGLEQDPALAAKATENLAATGATNTRIVTGPLSAGLPAQAPFDVILVNGAVAREPKELLSQLADGGRLATVWRAGAAGYAVLYLNHEGALGERRAFDAFLPVLPGFEKPQGFSF